jgi:hypothetical protein
MAENYLSYLQTVLGVEVVFNPTSSVKPVFLFEKSSSLSSVLEPGPASELLEKILSAMGWQRSQIDIKEMSISDIQNQSQGDEIIFTSLQEAKSWETLKGFVKTYHPTEMLADPSLKKSAWESLQKARRTA